MSLLLLFGGAAAPQPVPIAAPPRHLHTPPAPRRRAGVRPGVSHQAAPAPTTTRHRTTTAPPRRGHHTPASPPTQTTPPPAARRRTKPTLVRRARTASPTPAQIPPTPHPTAPIWRVLRRISLGRKRPRRTDVTPPQVIVPDIPGVEYVVTAAGPTWIVMPAPTGWTTATTPITWAVRPQ